MSRCKASVTSFPQILLIHLLLSILGCTNRGQTTEHRSQLTRLKVQVLPLLSNSPYYIAHEEGYFTDEDIEIEFIHFQRSIDALPAAINGDLDVLSMSIKSGTLNLMAVTDELRIVADKGYLPDEGCSYMQVLARNDHLEGKKDEASVFRGATIMCRPSSTGNYMLINMLEENKLDIADINHIYLPSSAAILPFEQGSIDIIIDGEPWASRIKSSGNAVEYIELGKRFPNFQVGMIVFGPNMYAYDEEVGVRFLTAFLRGVRQYKEGPTERNLEIISKYTEIEVDVLKEACWTAYSENGEINLETILDFQQWAFDRGEVTQLLTADEIFDGRFVEKAMNRLLERNEKE